MNIFYWVLLQTNCIIIIPLLFNQIAFSLLTKMNNIYLFMRYFHKMANAAAAFLFLFQENECQQQILMQNK